MGRYIEWDDVIDRYPELNSLGGSDEISSAYIVYAEAFTDGMLTSHFTPPFSNNNMVVKDLCIDYTYWRAARFKLDDAVAVKSSYFETIMLLKKGQMSMIDDTGVETGAKAKLGVHSTTESFHSSFGMDIPERWHIDEDLIAAERDRHDG